MIKLRPDYAISTEIKKEIRVFPWRKTGKVRSRAKERYSDGGDRLG
jgi:hypothetical protein